MLQDMEAEAEAGKKADKKAGDQQAQVDDAEPSAQPNDNWLGREVRKIAREEGMKKEKKLSQRAKKKAMVALKEAILKAGDGSCQFAHKSLPESFVSVACGWVIGDGVLDVAASIGGQTLLQGTGNHQRDPKRDLPASKGGPLTARGRPSLHGASSVRVQYAVYANRHDGLVGSLFDQLGARWAS